MAESQGLVAMVLLFIDHDVTNVIVQGVVDHYPQVDVMRAKEVGLAEAADDELLSWAADHGGLLISSDESTMSAAAYARVTAGVPMLGVIMVRQSLAYRVAIEDLAAIALCSKPDDWVNKVQFLPLVN